LLQPSSKEIAGLNHHLSAASATPTNMVTVNALGQLQFWNLATPSPTRQSLKLNAIQSPTTSTPTNVKALQTVQLPSSSSATLTSTALSPNGQQVAIANTEGWVEWFQLQPNKPPQLISRWQNLQDDAQPASKTSADQFPVVVRQLKFSHDGKKLLGVSDDTTIRVWELGSHKPSQILRGHTTTITQAQFSHNDQQIISASWDHTARIWDVASGRLIKLLQHQDMVLSAVLSPDDQLIVTANWDGTARIWDVATGTLRVILAGHRGSVMDAEFSPDGRSIVTASGDGTARLWDAETGTEQAQLRMPTLNNHVQSVRRAFFSPDGQYVVTLADDGKVRLWAATWSALIKLARDRTLRQLSHEECVRYLRLVPDQCPVLSAPNAAPPPPIDAIATQ
jgi:WD40 repeat protein